MRSAKDITKIAYSEHMKARKFEFKSISTFDTIYVRKKLVLLNIRSCCLQAFVFFFLTTTFPLLSMLLL